ncbi:MAG: VanZ family protein [Gemmatimonas sp.]|uniref:VanZ family protein n=1 Tax=Gemmatimonas sp. TaxID=1962908 RepID=UPI0022C34552|nr:VanZ family protein [Gemmatimonas sp.]MCZ8011726.1 VanZ family protein [Gemmatimonas sp.]MCZ8265725.1 VanZ family protein [Gemmatimonas sp.]
MRSRQASAALLLGAVGVIAMATLVPVGGVPATRVPPAWCLVCGPAWLADAVANVVLFLPLGAAMYVRRRGIHAAGVVGLTVSLAVELVQWSGWLGSRSPAIADVATNTIGALVGWATMPAARAVRGSAGASARRLANAWGGMVVLVLVGTSLLLQPAVPRNAAAETITRPSRFSYSPAFGYFGGEIRAVAFNGQPIPHPGYGPLVREAMAFGDTFRLELQLRRLEPTMTRRSIVFVHAAGDSTPVLMLAQHGSRVELRQRTNAEAAGFPPLVLVHETGVWSPDEPVRIVATSSSRTMAITTLRNGRATSSQWSVTPLVGWALWQSMIGPGHGGARLVHGGWIVVLVLPLGWLVTGTRPGRPVIGFDSSLLWPTLLALTLLLLPVAFGNPPVRLVDWLLVIGSYGAGTLLRRDNATRQSAGQAA